MEDILANQRYLPKIREIACAYANKAGLEPSCLGKNRERDPRALKEIFAENPFIAAPMAGVSDAAYRIMNICGGAQFAYSEMVSVAGLHYESDKTWELIEPNEAEPALVVQLFGSKPEQFAEACTRIQERLGARLQMIDINMACPVHKVIKKGEGSALMCDPERAAEIVRACVSHTSVPVSCKIRRGFYIGKETSSEFARALQDVGASALAVHGRYAHQLYSGVSDASCIARVVGAVDIPVIASGDALSAPQAADLLRTSQAQAVMIARGTYGNPWIFKDAYSHAHSNQMCADDQMVQTSDMSADYTLDKHVYAHSIEEKCAALRMHVRFLEATGAHMARARSLASWYLAHLPHAREWRSRFMKLVTSHDFISTIDEYEEMCNELIAQGSSSL